MVFLTYKLFEPNDHYSKLSETNVGIQLCINMINLDILVGRSISPEHSKGLNDILEGASRYIQMKRSGASYFVTMDCSREFYDISRLVKNPNDLDNVEKVINQMKNILENPPTDQSERRYLSNILTKFAEKFKLGSKLGCYGEIEDSSDFLRHVN